MADKLSDTEVIELVTALRRLRLTTFEIHQQTGIDIDVIRVIPFEQSNNGLVSMEVKYDKI
jgi:hypothetical protein